MMNDESLNQSPFTAAALLADFPAVNKTQWLQQIARDLKDRSLEELTWQAPGGLSVSPFAHRDDFQAAPAPLVSDQSGWEICEDIAANPDAGAAGKQAQESLQGGAEGLCFHLDKTPDSAYFAGITDGIYLDYIGLHFAGAGITENPGAVFVLLDQVAQQRQLPTSSLRGSLYWNPGQSAPESAVLPDWRYAADLIQFSRENFPKFRIFTLESSGEDPAEALAALLSQIDLYLTQLTKRGVTPTAVVQQIQVEMAIGKSYFLEIAKIRAFKILWFNLLKSWNIEPTWPIISARFDPAAYHEVLYTNMIRATTMAMSAVLGGVSHLTVLPYNTMHPGVSTQSQSFARRIARNVQHLLKMESYLDVPRDPAAGSYYIEQLTHQIAAKAWSNFRA